MPMFYFQPFNFHKKKPSSSYDISGADVFIFVALNIVALGLFIGLIAVPAYMLWSQAPK